MGKVAQKNFSEKNKKSEILEAYNKVLKELREKTKSSKEENEKKEEKEILNQTKDLSLEKIVKTLADLKLQTSRAVEMLEENMTEEFKKLNTLRKAIEIENKQLEEVHQIQINADSLEALLESQKRSKEEFEEKKEDEEIEFENEMTEKRDVWEEEKKEYEKKRKEYEENIKKQREREEEEYKYNIAMQRKLDKDNYDMKKSALERELKERKEKIEIDLANREEKIKSREEEYLLLKSEVEKFPKKLEASIKETEKNVKDAILKDYDHKTTLMKKDIDAEKRLYEQKIVSLESKISEQQKLIAQLTQKVNESGKQVQSIALKAVEGAFPRERSFLENNKDTD